MTQTLARTLAFTSTLTSNATRLKANLDRKHHFMVQTTMLRRFNSVIKDQKRSLLLETLSAMRMNRFQVFVYTLILALALQRRP